MMYLAPKVAALSLLAIVNAIAPVVSDSPTDVTYEATFKKTILGSVAFSSTNGSVLVEVDLSGLPETGGPFLYHIHALPVPANGSCLGTAGHFNPFLGSANATIWDEMELGDLSGKHGEITGTSILTSYIDPYLSLNPDSKSYFGGLSVVVHYHNTTRLACANITEEATSSSSPSANSTTVSSTNGAAYIGAGVAPLVAGAVALII